MKINILVIIVLLISLNLAGCTSTLPGNSRIKPPGQWVKLTDEPEQYVEISNIQKNGNYAYPYVIGAMKESDYATLFYLHPELKDKNINWMMQRLLIDCSGKRFASIEMALVGMDNKYYEDKSIRVTDLTYKFMRPIAGDLLNKVYNSACSN